MSSNRHAMVDATCENCGKPFQARKERVDKGMGKYCSRKCSGEATGREKMENYGKENAKKHFEKRANRWMVHWRDAETKEQKNSTYARWYWEMNHGEIPRGFQASYRDGNPLNIDPDNIYLQSSEEKGDKISQRMMGHPTSIEARKKMSNAKKGGTLSEEHKSKIGEKTKERWEQGAFDDPEIRKAFSEQGKKTLGSKRTYEQKKQMADSHRKMYEEHPELRAIKGEQVRLAHQKDPTIGERISSSLKEGYKEHPERKDKISKALKGRVFTDEHLKNLSGEKNHNYIGFDNHGYPTEFNKKLKDKIKSRDNNTCCLCGMDTSSEKRSCIHHMDGNRKNTSEDNLVLLCRRCHLIVHNLVGRKDTLDNDLLGILVDKLKQ